MQNMFFFSFPSLLYDRMNPVYRGHRYPEGLVAVILNHSPGPSNLSGAENRTKK